MSIRENPTTTSTIIVKKKKERISMDRETLIAKLLAKEEKRKTSIRLGEQQEEVKESVLELYTLNAFLHSVAETYLNRFSL